MSQPNAASLPTQNYLNREERTRLIRHTRKIRDVVGETPRVVDVSSIPPPPPRHQVRQSGSKSVMAASDPRPLLYIRVPDCAPTHRAPSTPAPSPTLTVFLKLTSSTDRDDGARRRKMAKLERTLGANIPSELVFPPQDLEARRYRRLTARTVKAECAESLSRRQSTGRKHRDTPADSISHGWVWVGKREEIPSDVRKRRQPGRVESDLPFDWDRHQEDNGVPATETCAGGMNRRESGWSGEWAGSDSVRNMEDIVRRLRRLKV
ncbi:hypothetical protein C8R47DRAFT_1303407 [Mycena vitilis]|nr:hypothetical protein C8R47DRAFT_1303407 [Mycena vitilis]